MFQSQLLLLYILPIAHLCNYETATIFTRLFPRKEDSIWGGRNRFLGSIKSFEWKKWVVCLYSPPKN